jgi:hypothetical protein
MAKRP